jgi:hypothetical protein
MTALTVLPRGGETAPAVRICTLCGVAHHHGACRILSRQRGADQHPDEGVGGGHEHVRGNVAPPLADIGHCRSDGQGHGSRDYCSQGDQRQAGGQQRPWPLACQHQALITGGGPARGRAGRTSRSRLRPAALDQIPAPVLPCQVPEAGPFL